MPLFHTSCSGFFPFFTTPYGPELAAGAHAGGTLFTAPLADLVKIFWTAKQVELTAALNYSIAYASDGSTDEGSITGSGAITSGFFALPPQARTIKNSMVDTLSVDSGNFTMAGIYGRSYSATSPGFPGTGTWFADLQTAGGVSGGIPYSTVALDLGPKNFYSRINWSAQLGFTSQVLRSDPAACTTPQYLGASFFNLQINGINIVPASTFPIWWDAFSSGGGDFALTGSLTMNFNSFWTP